MKKLLLLLFCGFPLTTLAQKMPDYGLHWVRLNDTDKTIQAEIIPVTSMPQVKSELDYYWYGSGSIHQQQGGFSGQLLNGAYNEFYLNKNLKRQGAYEKGLKSGIWKEWTEDGKLRARFTWNKGSLSGPFSRYDSTGKSIEFGAYRQNRLDGAVSYNAGTDSAKVIRYKKGRIIPPKSGSFLKRLHIFKKKTTVKDSIAH